MKISSASLNESTSSLNLGHFIGKQIIWTSSLLEPLIILFNKGEKKWK
jgi:hypothetical protein